MSATSAKGVLEPIDEQLAIRKARQRVVERLAGQLFFELFPLADVVHGQHDASHAWVVAKTGGKIDGEQAAIPVADLALEVDPSSRLQVGQKVGEVSDVRPGDEVLDGAAEQLAGAVAQQRFERRALVADHAVVDDQDHVGSVLQERLLPFVEDMLAVERALGDAIREVPRDHGQRDDQDDHPADELRRTGARERRCGEVDGQHRRAHDQRSDGPAWTSDAIGHAHVPAPGRCTPSGYGTPVSPAIGRSSPRARTREGTDAAYQLIAHRVVALLQVGCTA